MQSPTKTCASCGSVYASDALEHKVRSPDCKEALDQPLYSSMFVGFGETGMPARDWNMHVSSRLATFNSSWELSSAKFRPSSIVTHGKLFSFGSEDKVGCEVCGTGLEKWEADDDPLEEHRRICSELSSRGPKKCPLVEGMIKDVPIEYDRLWRSCKPDPDASWQSGHTDFSEKRLAKEEGAFEELAQLLFVRRGVFSVTYRHVAQTQYRRLAARLESFSVKSDVLSPPLMEHEYVSTLATNGFFLGGQFRNSTVICFCCGLTLRNLTPAMIESITHIHQYFSQTRCWFVREGNYYEGVGTKPLPSDLVLSTEFPKGRIVPSDVATKLMNLDPLMTKNMKSKWTDEQYVKKLNGGFGRPYVMHNYYPSDLPIAYPPLQCYELCKDLTSTFANLLLSAVLGNKTKRQNTEQPKTDMCVNCKERRRRVVVLECGHFLVCEECYRQNPLCLCCGSVPVSGHLLVDGFAAENQLCCIEPECESVAAQVHINCGKLLRCRRHAEDKDQTCPKCKDYRGQWFVVGE